MQNGTVANCYEAVCLTGNNMSTSANYNQTVRNMLMTLQLLCRGILRCRRRRKRERVTDNRITHTGGTTNNSNGGYAFVLYLYLGSGITASGNVISTLTAANGGNAFGIYSGSNCNAISNTIAGFQVTGGETTYALYDVNFPVGNLASDAVYGLYNCSKYTNNLTLNCNNAFTGGTSVWTNN